MNELLQAVYDRFYKPDVPEPLLQEIDVCHHQLIDVLSKEERKILLRLIDDKDHAAELQSIDSFKRGFQLAWQLSNELSVYASDHPIAEDQPVPLSGGGGGEGK